MQMIINDNLHTKKLNEEQSQTEKFKKNYRQKAKERINILLLFSTKDFDSTDHFERKAKKRTKLNIFFL